MKTLTSLLSVCALATLSACSKPPPLETSAEWSVGECGEAKAVILVKTAPGAEVHLYAGSSSLEAVADDQGLARVELGPDDRDSFEVTAMLNDKISSGHVTAPSGFLSNTVHKGRDGAAPSFSTRCLSQGSVSAICAVSVMHGELLLGVAPDGSVIRHGGVEAKAGDTPGMAKVPVDSAAVLAWDLGVFKSGGACPHVVLPDVTVSLPSGSTYKGEVWLGEEGARWVLADVGSRAFGGGLGPEPTGKAALLVSRFSDTAPAEPVRVDGEAARLSDVAWVARMTQSFRDLGSCGQYTSSAGGSQEVFRRAVDLNVQIVERATGKVVGETTIQGKDGGCASVTMTGSLHGDAPTAAADAWISSELAKLRG